MAITAVGTLQSVQPGALSSGTLTWPAQGAVGDLVVLAVANNQSTPVHPTGISGGGITWDAAAIRVFASTDGSHWDVTLWKGVLNSTAGGTITVTLSGADDGAFTIDGQQFTSGNGSSSTWTVDTSAGAQNTTNTAMTWPSLTPAAAGELYVGLGTAQNAPAAGSTSGFTYQTDAGSGLFAYDLASGTGALQPTASQSPGGYAWYCSALIIAGGGASFLAPRPKVVDQAVKRASSW